MIVPRYYQLEAVQSLYDYFSKHTGNPILAMPTGTGKSYVIALFSEGVFKRWPSSRFICATHTEELIDQNEKELRELWPMAPAGIYSAGLGKREVRPITFAGIQSIADKAELFGHIDILIIDECHLLGPKDETMYQSFIADLLRINPNLKVIGLTATPYRLGQGLLTDHTFSKDGKPKPPLFTDICYDITKLEDFNRLIREGFLCNLFPRPTTVELDVSKVHTLGGEFIQKELQAAVDVFETTHAAIKESVALGWQRKHWLIFGVGSTHCEHIVEILKTFGISAAAIHSKTPKEDRKKFIKMHKSGELRALVNNKILTTGYNHKGIDLIIDLQPTESPSKHVQKYGRGTRPFPGKTDCLVLDFARNTARLGPINDPRIPKARKNKADGAQGAPVKICEFCMTYNHISAVVCQQCQHEFPARQIALATTAGTETIIRVGEPARIDIFKVDTVDFRKYLSKNVRARKPPSLLVVYHCGRRTFFEWQCFEHTGIASKRARDWWRDAASDWETEPPKTVDEARSRLECLQRVTHIKVHINTPEPKVMGHDYSGTHFGEQLPT